MLLSLLFSSLVAIANSEAVGHDASGAQAAPAHGDAPAVEEILVDEPGTISIHDSPAEIMIPGKIWDLIYTDTRTKPRVTFVPIKLVLKEKNPGVLLQEEVIMQFPRGGGEVDLAQFVKDKRGSFFVKFSFEMGASSEGSFVYFVSRNRKRKVDGMVLGSGCKSFFEVKSYLGKVDSKGGILVNTTRLRHLSVLGGSFVFANVTGKEVRISQVSFKDSKNKSYFCDTKPDTKNGDKENHKENHKENQSGETSDESSEGL